MSLPSRLAKDLPSFGDDPVASAQHLKALRDEGFMFTMSPTDADGMDMDDPMDRARLDLDTIEAGAPDDWEMFCEGFGDDL